MATEDLQNLLAPSGFSMADLQGAIQRFTPKVDADGLVSSVLPGTEDVQRAATGMRDGLIAELRPPVGTKTTNVMREAELSARAPLGNFATAATGQGSQLISSAVGNTAASLGLPKELTAPFAGLAQQIASGNPAGLAGAALSAATGAAQQGAQTLITGALSTLGVAAGPIGMVGGALLGAALGALFEQDAAEPPLPAPPLKRELIPRMPEVITLQHVLEALFFAEMRWHSFPVTRGAAAALAATYEVTFEGLENLKNMTLDDKRGIYCAVLPSCHSRAFRITKNGGARIDGATRTVRGLGVEKPNYIDWCGTPIPAPGGDGTVTYDFATDALADFIGYNTTLAAVAAGCIQRAFGTDAAARAPHLDAFRPFLGQIGWAEFIVSSSLMASGFSMGAMAHEGSNRFVYSDADIAARTVWPNHRGNVAKALCAGYDAKLVKKGNSYLRDLAVAPTRSGISALAFVTLQLRTATAAAPALRAQGQAAARAISQERTKFEAWQTEALNQIESQLAGVRTEVGVIRRKQAEDNALQVERDAQALARLDAANTEMAALVEGTQRLQRTLLIGGAAAGAALLGLAGYAVLRKK